MASTGQSAAYRLAPPVGPEGRPGILMVEKRLEPHDAADLEITPIEFALQCGISSTTWSARFSTR